MDTDPVEADETGDERQPGPLQLLPVLPIVIAVAWVVRSYELYPWVSTGTMLVISLAGAALIGLPALFWALDHGHRGLIPLSLIGMLAGLLPLGLIVASGAIGLLVRVGPERTMALIERGAPIPGMGAMPWITFARAEVPAAAIGAISAAIYWLVMRLTRRWSGGAGTSSKTVDRSVL